MADASAWAIRPAMLDMTVAPALARTVSAAPNSRAAEAIDTWLAFVTTTWSPSTAKQAKAGATPTK
jgi:hypothetical protein